MRLKLIHKLLIALFASMAAVMLLVVLFSRASIGLGFEEYLTRQEQARLETFIPVLSEWYASHGNWQDLATEPRQFHELLFPLGSSEGQRSKPPPQRPRPGRGPGPGSGPGPGPRTGPGPGSGPGPGPGPRQNSSVEQHPLQWRVFLLNAEFQTIAGRYPPAHNRDDLLAIEYENEIVGWLGARIDPGQFAPEEQAFLQGQRNFLLAGLGTGLLIAALLAWLLARHLGRPITAIATGIRSLAAGDFKVQVDTQGYDEISRLGTDVNRLAQSLAEHENSRQRFMADIAHELRTPLAIINGEVEAMRDGVRDLDLDNLASVQEEVHHLAALVGDLHKLAMSDSGALSYKMDTLDLAHLVDSVIDSTRDRVADHGHDLAWSPPGAPLLISADEQRLRQLMLNLLENSIRHTDAPGRIEVQLTANKTNATLSVSDSAPGASVEDCTKIFDRLHRLESSRNRDTGGSGLGLAICRNIVEAHGGSIDATPGPLSGLLITVKLPLKL